MAPGAIANLPLSGRLCFRTLIPSFAISWIWGDVPRRLRDRHPNNPGARPPPPLPAIPLAALISTSRKFSRPREKREIENREDGSRPSWETIFEFLKERGRRFEGTREMWDLFYYFLIVWKFVIWRIILNFEERKWNLKNLKICRDICEKWNLE